MNVKPILTLGVAATLCLTLFSCSTDSGSASGEASDAQGQNTEELQALAESQLSEGMETVSEGNEVLGFELTQRDDDSYEEIISTFKVTNNSESDIEYFSVRFAYRDSEENIVCEDERFNDTGIPSGKSAYMKSYSYLDGIMGKEDIADIAVISYQYRIDGESYDVDLGGSPVAPAAKPDDGENIELLATDEPSALSPDGFKGRFESTSGFELTDTSDDELISYAGESDDGGTIMLSFANASGETLGGDYKYDDSCNPQPILLIPSNCSDAAAYFIMTCDSSLDYEGALDVILEMGKSGSGNSRSTTANGITYNLAGVDDSTVMLTAQLK